MSKLILAFITYIISLKTS